MQRKFETSFIVMLSLLFIGMTACTKDHQGIDDPKDGKLSLQYQIYGAQAAETYALPGEAHECKMSEIYTIFFRATSHANPNKYVGYTRTAVSGSDSAGNARITMPTGEDAEDE